MVDPDRWRPTTRYKNLVLGQNNNFYLISLSILITRLLDNVWMFIIRRSYMLITSGSLRVKIVIIFDQWILSDVQF